MIGHSIPGGGYNFLLPSTTSNKTGSSLCRDDVEKNNLLSVWKIHINDDKPLIPSPVFNARTLLFIGFYTADHSKESEKLS